MLGVFVVCAMLLKVPTGLSLIAASMVGALAGGEGLPLRHLVEGAFTYIDPILIIASAMVFMASLEQSGALGSISRGLLVHLHSRPALLVVGLTVFIMFPGMITGQSTATVLTTGAIAAPVLSACGIPRPKVAAIIAMSAIYGMIAPPISLPTMIMGSGVDMPFTGFDIPLLIATMPLAIGVNLGLARRYLKNIDMEAVLGDLDENHATRHGWRLYLPIVLVALLLIGIRLVPFLAANLGIALVFLIGAAVGTRTGRRFNLFSAARRSIRQALPVMGILVGVGTFIQVMTLVGIRGMLVVTALGLPSLWKYAGVAVMMPLFGAVSAYGSASVLGVPFLLSFLGQDEIVVGSALSLFAGLGDLMPPTALAGMFAAQIVGEPNYFRVLKHTAVPAVITALWAIGMIILANPLAKIIPG
ncbi:MAG: TRAP transporter large permease subunit [bacterium]|nr:TRAP transporter large permease subunit [bacterium]